MDRLKWHFSLHALNLVNIMGGEGRIHHLITVNLVAVTYSSFFGWWSGVEQICTDARYDV